MPASVTVREIEDGDGDGGQDEESGEEMGVDGREVESVHCASTGLLDERRQHTSA